MCRTLRTQPFRTTLRATTRCQRRSAADGAGIEAADSIAGIRMSPRRARARAARTCAGILTAIAFAWCLFSDVRAAEDATIRITSPQANVMSGTDVVATVTRGQTFTVLGENGSWRRIGVVVDGTERKGWVNAKDFESVEPATRPVRPKASQVEYVEVTSDKLQIMSGKEVIGSLRKGEIRRVLNVRGAWLQISFESEGTVRNGWVSQQHVRRFSGPAGLLVRKGLPSRDGLVPAWEGTASLSVDWKTGQVAARATVDGKRGEPSMRMVMPPAETLEFASVDGPAVKRLAETLEISGPAASLLASLTPGTRSMWVESKSGDDVDLYRVDLPPVELSTKVRVKTYEKFDEGLVLFLPVKGLLPGYVVDHAIARDDQAPGESRPVTRGKGTLPRVADALESDGQDCIRIVIPFDKSISSKLTYFFRVRNRDGSESNTIAVEHGPSGVADSGTEVAAGSPAFVDAMVEVPSVELLGVSQAVEEIENAGLVPLVVDARECRLRDPSQIGSAMVVRQGLDHLARFRGRTGGSGSPG